MIRFMVRIPHWIPSAWLQQGRSKSRQKKNRRRIIVINIEGRIVGTKRKRFKIRPNYTGSPKKRDNHLEINITLKLIKINGF